MAFHLTDSQSKAINHEGSHLQLVACAGSGKTEVVSQRVARMIGTGGYLPGNLIAFTFTEKAAAELKDRISQRVRERCGEVPGMAEMYVGTIHGYCRDFLQSEAPEFLRFGVLSDVQQTLFVDRNSRASGLTESTDLKGKPLTRFRDTRNYIQALGMLREANIDEASLASNSIYQYLPNYLALLKKHSYLDYTSMMVEALRVMMSSDRAIAHLKANIKHVIVDEYQDLNPLQEQIVRRFEELGATICVVGDDDQTIYQWRGSDVRNIIDFQERYNGTEQIRLQENFRSSEGIVEVAREIIEENSDRLPKEIQSVDAQPFEPYDIVAKGFDDPQEEASFIADQIQALKGVAFADKGETRGLTYSDMSILLRSVNHNAEPIVEELRSRGIPYVVVDMNHLFRTEEAQAARSIFYYLGDNFRAPTTLDDVFDAWWAMDLGIDEANLNAGMRFLEQSKRDLKKGEGRFGLYTIQRVFRSFLEEIGLREDAIPQTPTGEERGEVIFYNLGKFSQIISDFEQIHFHSKPSEKYQGFASFLMYGAESTYPEGSDDSAYTPPNAVQILTIHKAKGLQWPVVFVPALLRNRFPSKKVSGRTVWHLIPRESIENQARYEGTKDDERRLFYVAATRSEKFLFMTYGPVPGKNNLYSRPSEFYEAVLKSKYVKRRIPDYSGRKRAPERANRKVSNISLSFSELKYFMECPYQFKLRILYGFNAPIHEALGFGKSLHDILAEVHYRALDGDFAESTEAESLVEKHLHLPFAYQSLRDVLHDNAVNVISDYITKHSEDLKNTEFSEKPIELHFDDGISVIGRVDLVKRIDTGEVTIVDFKSNDRSQEEDVTEAQLHTYALGYRELTGRDADYVEIYNLDSNTGKPRSVDEDFIQDVSNHVKDAAQALREGQLNHKPSKRACGSCDWKKMCSKAV